MKKKDRIAQLEKEVERLKDENMALSIKVVYLERQQNVTYPEWRWWPLIPSNPYFYQPIVTCEETITVCSTK